MKQVKVIHPAENPLYAAIVEFLTGKFGPGNLEGLEITHRSSSSSRRPRGSEGGEPFFPCLQVYAGLVGPLPLDTVQPDFAESWRLEFLDGLRTSIAADKSVLSRISSVIGVWDVEISVSVGDGDDSPDLEQDEPLLSPPPMGYPVRYVAQEVDFLSLTIHLI